MWYFLAFLLFVILCKKRGVKGKVSNNYQEIASSYFNKSVEFHKNKDWEQCLKNYIKSEFLFVCGASKYGFTDKDVFKESHIRPSLLSRYARDAIINLNLNKKSFKKFISEIEVEEFKDPYPVSLKNLIPEFLKAYDEMKEDFEKTKSLLNKHKLKS